MQQQQQLQQQYKMAVDILITLTVSGIDNGAFYDVFSDVDNFSTAFTGSIPLASIQAGVVVSAPDGTTIVRVCSKQNTCINCVDVSPTYTTTTTTTISP